jgi:hypothetical protein
MKDRLEIDPEIRGLLEEIAADPRSAIRLAPRRALRQWFERGEAARTSDMATTKAERRLIEAYREEVAELLYEASVLAYHRQPKRHHRRIELDGTYTDPLRKGLRWKRAAEAVLQASNVLVSGRELLRQALHGESANGFALAQASFHLSPSNRTREFLALNTPWDHPHLALSILQPLQNSSGVLRLHGVRQRGARLCAMEDFVGARRAYVEAVEISDRPAIDLCYALNLSFLLADEPQARAIAERLQTVTSESDRDVIEARRVIGEWLVTRNDRDKSTARSTARRALHTSSPADVIQEAYQ